MIDGRKVALIVIVAAVVMAALLMAPLTAAEEAATPSPSPSPTVAPSPSPSPASDDMVAWALGWRQRAVRIWEKWNHARVCCSLERVRFDSPKPERSAPNSVWYAAGREWKHQCPEYREKFAARWQMMTHPGGSGAERWRPLVRWYWPASLVDRALWVMSLESHGNPLARNPSGAAGLFQLYPAPERWAEPDYNVWYAYWKKYRPAGSFSPWVVTH